MRILDPDLLGMNSPDLLDLPYLRSQDPDQLDPIQPPGSGYDGSEPPDLPDLPDMGSLDPDLPDPIQPPKVSSAGRPLSPTGPRTVATHFHLRFTLFTPNRLHSFHTRTTSHCSHLTGFSASVSLRLMPSCTGVMLAGAAGALEEGALLLLAVLWQSVLLPPWLTFDTW